MDEQKWETKRLEKVEEFCEKLDERMDKHDEFKTSTIEKLTTVFKRLQDLEATNQWVSRTFFYLIFGGAVTAVGSVIVWFVTR